MSDLSNIFTLSKGQSFCLDKQLSNVYIGAGWEANELENGFPFDVDLSVFFLDAAGNLVTTPTPTSGFVGHIFPKAINHGFSYGGDDKTGNSSGDAEFIKGQLDLIGPTVHRVMVAASIHCWRKRSQSFDTIRNAYLVVKDGGTDTLLRKVVLTDEAKGASSFIFGSFYRTQDAWSFTAEMKPLYDGMRALFAECNVTVAEETK